MTYSSERREFLNIAQLLINAYLKSGCWYGKCPVIQIYLLCGILMNRQPIGTGLEGTDPQKSEYPLTNALLDHGYSPRGQNDSAVLGHHFTGK
jgi:hypothetical protein